MKETRLALIAARMNVEFHAVLDNNVQGLLTPPNLCPPGYPQDYTTLFISNSLSHFFKSIERCLPFYSKT